MLLLMKKKTTHDRVELTRLKYSGEKIQKSNTKKSMNKYIGFEEPLLLPAGKESRPE